MEGGINPDRSRRRRCRRLCRAGPTPGLSPFGARAPPDGERSTLPAKVGPSGQRKPKRAGPSRRRRRSGSPEEPEAEEAPAPDRSCAGAPVIEETPAPAAVALAVAEPADRAESAPPDQLRPRRRRPLPQARAGQAGRTLPARSGPRPSPLTVEKPRSPEAPPQRKARDAAALAPGLARTRAGWVSRLGQLFAGKREIDPALVEEIEKVLLTADIGVRTSQKLLEEIRSSLGRRELADPARGLELPAQALHRASCAWTRPRSTSRKPSRSSCSPSA